MKIKWSVLIVITTIIILSCNKKFDRYDRIEGTWDIDYMNLLGTDIGGDGSSLSFTNCNNPPCEGSDYLASDKTTGNFTYLFIDDNKTLSIEDTSSNLGGNYNGDWEIITFKKSKLKIKIETGLLGAMTIEMSK